MFDKFDPLQDENNSALRSVAIGLGLVVYVSVLFFTGAHNINLMTAGVAQAWRWAAYLGVLALEISALAFPLALHYWAFSPMHRGALLLFYALDFVLLFANTIIDYSLVSGNVMPEWGEAYLTYFAPGSPLFALFAWAILLSLDPRSQEHMKMQQIQAGIRLRLMSEISRAMSSDEVRSAILSEAKNRAGDLTGSVLADDRQPAGRLPANTGNHGAEPGHNGHHPAELQEIALNPTKPHRKS